MAKIVRQAAGVVAIVGELVSRRMAKHVRVNLKQKLCSSTCALNHPQEPSRGHWRASLSDEHVWARTLQGPQRSELWPMQGMNAFNATLGPIDMQPPLLEINLRPAKLTQLGSAKAMS